MNRNRPEGHHTVPTTSGDKPEPVGDGEAEGKPENNEAKETDEPNVRAEEAGRKSSDDDGGRNLRDVWRTDGGTGWKGGEDGAIGHHAEHHRHPGRPIADHRLCTQGV